MHHKVVAEKVEAVSMAVGIIAGIVAVGAILAAPKGFSAVAVALGISSEPLIVTAAPVISLIATVIGFISGGTYFYSKWKARKAREEAARAENNETLSS